MLVNELNGHAMDSGGDCRCQLAETVIKSYFVDVQLHTGVVTQELVCGLVKGLIAVTRVLCR